MAVGGAVGRESCIRGGPEEGVTHGRINGLGRQPGELYVGIPALGGGRGGPEEGVTHTRINGLGRQPGELGGRR